MKESKNIINYFERSKRTYPLVLLVCFSFLFSCTLKQNTSIENIKFNQKSSSNTNSFIYVNNISNNKEGASVFVTINLEKDLPFNTKANANGKNSASLTSFRLNLCTDNTRPFNTRLSTNGVIVSRIVSGTGPSSYSSVNLLFTNVPIGTYYATVSANDTPLPANSPLLTEGIVSINNNGLPYASPDTGAKIGVSSNSVTVNNDLTFSFSSGTSLSIPLNVQVVGASIDTTLNLIDVRDPFTVF